MKVRSNSLQLRNKKKVKIKKKPSKGLKRKITKDEEA